MASERSAPFGMDGLPCRFALEAVSLDVEDMAALYHVRVFPSIQQHVRPLLFLLSKTLFLAQENLP